MVCLAVMRMGVDCASLCPQLPFSLPPASCRRRSAYCSVACQKSDWKDGHKLGCAHLAERLTEKNEAAMSKPVPTAPQGKGKKKGKKKK